MADTPRTPVFGRLKGYQPSDLNPQDGVAGVSSQLFPPPPGQVQLAPQRTVIQRALPWMAPFFPALIAPVPSTDIPRAPNFTRYRDYDRRVSINAQPWVWQTPQNIPPAPSTDVPRAAHFTRYRGWNRWAAVNAQAWVWQDVNIALRKTRPVWFAVT